MGLLGRKNVGRLWLRPELAESKLHCDIYTNSTKAPTAASPANGTVSLDVPGIVGIFQGNQVAARSRNGQEANT
jgi:hypothetical protein